MVNPEEFTKLADLIAKLRHVVIEMDKAEERSDLKYKGRVNIYRIGLLLEAVNKTEIGAGRAVAGGDDVQKAFIVNVCDNFTATRRMHTFLKKIDPSIEVDRQHWILNASRKGV